MSPSEELAIARPQLQRPDPWFLPIDTGLHLSQIGVTQDAGGHECLAPGTNWTRILQQVDLVFRGLSARPVAAAICCRNDLWQFQNCVDAGPGTQSLENREGISQ